MINATIFFILLLLLITKMVIDVQNSKKNGTYLKEDPIDDEINNN